MKVLNETLIVQTRKGPEFVDITDAVTDLVSKSGVKSGCVIIFSKHTTAAISINENEPLLIEDMECFLERIAPPSDLYNHNDFSRRTVNMNEDECPNGHSHCQHLFLGASEAVPLIDGKMQFGPWQRIFLVELERSRPREVIVQVMGE